MLESNIVVLVGGASTGKTKFYTTYTNSAYHWPTVKSTPNVTMWINPSIVLVDTPGILNLRNPVEYSWQGIFQFADIILDFGEWSEDHVFGSKGSLNPKYMTWSGDNEETMKRIKEYLQGTQ